MRALLELSEDERRAFRYLTRAQQESVVKELFEEAQDDLPDALEREAAAGFPSLSDESSRRIRIGEPTALAPLAWKASHRPPR